MNRELRLISNILFRQSPFKCFKILNLFEDFQLLTKIPKFEKNENMLASEERLR